MESKNTDTPQSDFPRQRIERRKRKKDWVIITTTVLSFLGWIASIVMLVLLERARPVNPNFFSRHFNAALSSAWNTALLRSSLAVLLAVFVICALGFLLNLTRHKRKSDRFNLSLIMLGSISFISIVLFIWRFHALL